MFQEFPKIPRLKREVIVTEKIDGTNACVVIEESIHSELYTVWFDDPNSLKIETDLTAGTLPVVRRVMAQSRTRMITPDNDNFGFARWVQENATELFKLGPGHHFGEWWGMGIQRRYGLSEKRFSLFNVGRWADAIKARDAGLTTAVPNCVSVVPEVCRGSWDVVDSALQSLRDYGSLAAPGFMQPEGVVVYHSASRSLYKVLIEADELPKGLAKAA